MALTDYSATQNPSAPVLRGLVRSLMRLWPQAQATRQIAAAPAAPTRPRHDANYLADIGMEIGF